MDNIIARFSRLSMVRVLIKLYITSALENEVWIASSTYGYWQRMSLKTSQHIAHPTKCLGVNDSIFIEKSNYHRKKI